MSQEGLHSIAGQPGKLLRAVTCKLSNLEELSTTVPLIGHALRSPTSVGALPGMRPLVTPLILLRDGHQSNRATRSGRVQLGDLEAALHILD